MSAVVIVPCDYPFGWEAPVNVHLAGAFFRGGEKSKIQALGEVVRVKRR
jgi:hypothetical protein